MTRVSSKPVGRPSVIDDAEAVSKILASIEMGNYVGDACAAAGIHVGTVFNLLKRGREKAKGREYEFWVAVQAAKRKAREGLVVRLRNHAEDDPNSALALLRALDPKRFAPQVQLLVRGELDELISRLEARLPPDVFRQVLAAATGRQLGPGARTVDAKASSSQAG